MNKKQEHDNSGRLAEKVDWFTGKCRQAGLRVTPQRVAVYKELIETDEHPSAEKLYRKLRLTFPSISLDTVNRTLLTLNEIGAASIVEGSGDVKRFDGGMEDHQHLKCVKCKRIIDFQYEPFTHIQLPDDIESDFTVLRKTVYVEGICGKCN